MLKEYNFTVDITSAIDIDKTPAYEASCFANMSEDRLTQFFKDAFEDMLQNNLLPKINEGATYAFINLRNNK